jgi:hypothetical protein
MARKSIAALFLLITLASCATPAHVPPGASVGLGIKDGSLWRWTRRVEHGCASWEAGTTVRNWYLVRLSVDRSHCREGPGLSYQAFADAPFPSDGGLDRITFVNYWPWTPQDQSNGRIFDSNGMWIGVRPCPHTLSPEQIAALRVVAQEARARARNESEARTLDDIDQRLAATDGAALKSGQDGCTN